MRRDRVPILKKCKRSLRQAGWLWIALLMALTACGGQPEAAASPAPPTQLPTRKPLPTVTPPPSPTVVPTATAAPPTATEPPPTTTPIPPTATHRPTPRPSATPEPESATTVSVNGLHYIFPVQPAGRVSYGTCHHDYPASDIFTPVGSQFVAVTAGVVDWVSYEDTWDPATDDPVVRGGLSVAIIGDDGVRYYGSHLSQIADGIKPGVRVASGDLLGLTGKTGDARFTDAHLHFGISHPTTPDDWAVRRGEINPYRYLNFWRKGIDRTPDLTVVGGGAC